MSDSNWGNVQNYDRIVYYIAPAALIGAILFCCFRIALVYYMQIRPRRHSVHVQNDQVQHVSDLEAASGAFPATFREIFLRAPPPSYDDTIKNDRRSLSVINGDRRVNQSRRTNHRAQTVSTSTYTVPDSTMAPPGYSFRRSTTLTSNSTLQVPNSSRSRLPSYEEAMSDNDERILSDPDSGDPAERCHGEEERRTDGLQPHS